LRSARFSPDGARIVTASDDGTARVWKLDVVEPSPGNMRYVIGSVGTPLVHRRGVVSAFFSGDGSRVVTASTDKSARVWDAETGAPLTEPLWHDEALRSAIFSPDGQAVVTASDDGAAEVWDVRLGSALPDALLSGSRSAQFSPDGSAVLLSGGAPAQVWNLSTGQLTATPSFSAGFPASQFSKDGASFLTIDGTAARTWTTATAAPLSPPLIHDVEISAARFSADGSRVATVANDGSVRFWNARSGSLIGSAIGLLKENKSEPIEADISSDLTFVAIGTAGAGNENNVAVWDVSRTPALLVIDLPTLPPVRNISFDPEHNRLLGIFEDTALVWPVRSPTSGPVLKLAHDGAIVSGRFSPTADRIVTASLDKTARLWIYAAGVFTPTVLRHDQPVEWVEFSPDGLRVVTASGDGARLWDAATGNPTSLPLLHAGSAVIMSQFSADSSKLVTTCEEGSTRVWHVPLGEERDVTSFASLAEAVSGYEVRLDGTLARLDQIARLEAERRTTNRTGSAKTLPVLVGEWVLADRWNRNISPFSTTSIEHYLKERLADESEDGRTVVRLYAGHPALGKRAGGQ
jgi:WD40 repeat protein